AASSAIKQGASELSNGAIGLSQTAFGAIATAASSFLARAACKSFDAGVMARGPTPGQRRSGFNPSRAEERDGADSAYARAACEASVSRSDEKDATAHCDSTDCAPERFNRSGADGER